MSSQTFLNPTCPKCTNRNFGIKELVVQGANFRHYAIFCTNCGCVVGTETMQDDARNNQIIQALNDVSSQISRLSNHLSQIEYALRAKGFPV